MLYNRLTLTRAASAAGLSSLILIGCSEPEPSPPELRSLPPLPESVHDRGPARGEERPARELTIALTGEIRGEIKPCGCPTTPYGGFERRSCYLNMLEAEGPPMLQLDAGDALLKGLTRRPGEDVEARARAVMELMSSVGVSAFAPGPADLQAVGLDGLRALESSASLAFVSATWLDAEGAPIFPPAVVVEAGGLKVGVIGLSGEVTAPELEGVVQWREPAAAVASALASLPEELDLLVGLGSLSGDQRAALTEAPLSAIFSTRGTRHDPPRATDGPLVVETSSRGRYVTTARIRLGSTPSRPLELEPELERLASLRRAVRPDDPETTAARSLRAREAEIDALGVGRNLVAVEDRPLGEELDGCAAAPSALLDRIESEQFANARRVVAEAPPFSPSYATSAACAGCHPAELSRWAFTDHADAYETLLGRGAGEDPECLLCHTTGFGEPGGFADLSLFSLRKHQAVQCEACHGKLAGHPERDDVAALSISPERCTTCHDPANSPNFDYEDYLRRGSCQEP